VTIPRRLRPTLALLAATALCRISGFLFQVLDIDEVDFALIGRSVAEGHLPYTQLVDIKPPLTYVAFAPAALFGKFSLWPMHLLGIFLVAGTGLILGRAVLRWTQDPVAATLTPWLYLLATLCDVPSVNSELLLNLPTAVAILLFVRAEDESALHFDLLAGVCIGVASLFKHQGGMPLASLGFVLLLRALADRQLRPILRGLAMTLGLLIPWALTFAVYAGTHHLPEFLDWCFKRNFGYVGDAGASEPALPRFLISTATCIGGTLSVWILAAQQTLAKRSRTGLALLAGLWLTWIPVAMGGRFYEHYYLQFAPWLAVVAAPGAANFLASKKSRALGLILVLLPALSGCGFFLVKGLMHGYQVQDPKLNQVADFLKRETRPDEELFVWGHISPIYYLSERRPGTRYFHCSVHLGNFDPGHLPPGFDPSRHVSQRDVDATLQDLEANKVAIFVDLAPAAIHHWDKLPLSAIPELDGYLHAHYQLIGDPAGALVYRRLPADTVR
jgi:4-amino-4-deoxy-L-arabinose transferase-like glycosyltransferase